MKSLTLTLCAVALTTIAIAESKNPPVREPKPGPDKKVVSEIKKVQLAPETAKKQFLKKPLVLKSKPDVKRNILEKDIAILEKQVNFKTQSVVVFSWRGSGQDQITVHIDEDDPMSVEFQFKRGRTRDLRPHLKVFVIDKTAKWSFK